MSKTTRPSAPEHDHQISKPSMKFTLSPSWPFKQIFDKYYALAEDDRDGFNALIQPRHTTRASILLHAVSENEITYTDYINHTFSILVEYHSSSKDYPAERNLPIIMCIDEGSTDGFKKELERTYNYNGRNEIDPELEIESLEVHFSGFHYENFVRHGLCSNDPFGKDTHALLRLLKTRGSVESIFTRCEKRKIERSSKAEHAGSVRSRGT